MEKNYTFKNTILWCGLLLATTYGFAQNLNFTIDTAVDSGVDIKETINSGGDIYVLTVNHVQNVEELDDLGSGDLVFYLGSGSSSTPFELTITKNGMPTNFNLNGIDYDTLGAGTISVTNQNGDFISSPTAYALGAGAISITNASNALSITQININPGDIDDLNDFGFHNINVNILDTLTVQNLVLEQQISIFPNPTNTGSVTITSNSNESKVIEIYNVLGKRVLSEITNSDRLNVQALSTGIYLLKITQGEATSTKKLIVN